MGNKNAKEVEEFQKRYHHHEDRKDPRYDQVQFYHEITNPQNLTMVKDRWTNEPGDSQEINALIENRKQIYHPNLCQCKNYIQEEDKQWFNSFYKHHMAFEYYDNNLEKEIKRRQIDVSSVPPREKEEQIWYTAHGLVDSDCQLAREGGTYHGDLQPSTVLLTNESLSPDVKTIDSTLVHLNKSTYSRMLYNRNVKAAISPTLCSQMEAKKVKPEFDPSREESWGLGMTMLCQANNTTLDDYYDWSIPRVRMDRVQQGLDNLDNNYSNQMHGFVEHCLRENESERSTMEENQAWFKNYRNEATNKTLNFQQKQRIVKEAPRPIPVVKGPDYTKTIDPFDDFFNQHIVAPQQNVNIISNITGGGFFDTVEHIKEEAVGNNLNFFNMQVN